MSEKAATKTHKSSDSANKIASKPAQQQNPFSPQYASPLQEKVLFLQRTIGNQATQRLVSTGLLHGFLQKRGIQPNLIISHPDDKYEQEADRMAERVIDMHGPAAAEKAPILTRVQPSSVVRRNIEEDEEKDIENAEAGAFAEQPPGPIREEEEAEKALIQAKISPEHMTALIQMQEEAGNNKPDVSPRIVESIASLRGAGNPLSRDIRDFFEPRFGYDFGRVRVHTGARAAETARLLNARAYTIDRDIAFGAGQYDPISRNGRQLLAHELTHVVQQRAANPSSSLVQRDPDGKKKADPDRVYYPIKVPKSMKTEEELDRYAEVMIFGRVMYFDWESKGWDVKALAREGKTVKYGYTASFVEQQGGKKPGEALRPPSSNPAYNHTKGKEREAINDEIDKRYWENTGISEGEMIEKGDTAKVDMWNTYRDEVMKDKKKLESLPPALKELMGGTSSFKPQDGFAQKVRF